MMLLSQSTPIEGHLKTKQRYQWKLNLKELADFFFFLLEMDLFA